MPLLRFGSVNLFRRWRWGNLSKTVVCFDRRVFKLPKKSFSKVLEAVVWPVIYQFVPGTTHIHFSMCQNCTLANDGLMRRETIALGTMLRDACVRVGFAIGRLGVTNFQASWLAQVGCGSLIGQARMSLRGQKCMARRLFACARKERSIAHVLNAAATSQGRFRCFWLKKTLLVELTPPAEGRLLHITVVDTFLYRKRNI